MASVIGVIGGSGFYALDNGTEPEATLVATPWDEEPVPVYRQQLDGRDVVFLPRHGRRHGTPPHKVNYRANIAALKQSGVDAIIAVNVVGGITEAMAPGVLVIPDQIIDYTWGRAHTFFDTLEGADNHVDFTRPYDGRLAALLAASAAGMKHAVITGAVYGCTQGPRLESAAEIERMRRDGCDIVGMTAMPEAALARELQLPYAGIALVVNWAAGVTDGEISFADITATLDAGIDRIRHVVLAAIARLT